MSDKIKELRDLRDLALTQKYEALIVKQNAEIDYRNKQKIFNELDKQLKQALQEEAENDTAKH
ncbi:hypothetical protein [Gardnerella vaginalis]|uniref:hypothetical protein n=1 Tax=Gardnerella vaginalis TaxID=2702 RepID=UPI00200C9039|nr:hypothetical protein [Gardnerella vaginalis]UQA84525.1 hypothetical protein K9E40_05710 [Gardnerella vaginalis]